MDSSVLLLSFREAREKGDTCARKLVVVAAGTEGSTRAQIRMMRWWWAHPCCQWSSLSGDVDRWWAAPEGKAESDLASGGWRSDRLAPASMRRCGRTELAHNDLNWVIT